MKSLQSLLTFVLVLFAHFVMARFVYADNHAHKRIFEKVDVTNALITLRVYDKGKPVTGLKMSDFMVVENGMEQQITECYMKKKQFQVETEGAANGVKRRPALVPRLYVLIFNISDYRLNINTGVDYFFDRVLRINDRLMVMTNRFFLQDHLVLDPQAERKRVKKLINVEMVWAKSTMNEIEKTLKSFIDEYNDFITIRDIRSTDGLSRAGGGAGGGNTGGGDGTGGANQNVNASDDPDGIERDAISQFVAKYINFVKETKKSFLHIPLREYIGLAAYLTEKKMEKWVLNFFQIPRFPQPEINSQFEEKIRANGFSMDILTAIMIPEETEVNSIGKLFVNTGATFHTLLMKYEGDLFNDYLRNYLSYRPITNDSEGVLRKISRMTGGDVVRSNQLKKFYDKISKEEDIYYVLAYKTNPLTVNKKRNVIVFVNNKNYKVLYDNQKRSMNFFQAQNSFLNAQQSKAPQIRLNGVNYGDRTLKILVSGFKIDATARPTAGHVQVRLQFLDQRSKVVMDKEKSMKSPEPRMHMAVKLSELGRGEYDVVIMVKDMVTGMEDLAIQEVAIKD